MLKKIAQVYPVDSTVPEAVKFYQALDENLDKGLNMVDRPVHGVVIVLNSLSENRPEYILKFLKSLMNVLKRLTKDHLSNGAATKESSTALLLCMQLLNTQLPHLGTDSKKILFSHLSTLIEKSQDISLLSEIITIVRSWITNNTGILNLKEKVSLLFKMTKFDMIGKLVDFSGFKKHPF